eukprot:TRINITY_DN12123_c0_g1_i3.p2 TRINITY_DN12123_c0_g1~~TRINITY_DN12123_c0_g1_i3.p2  ORF type:complete len:101 (-),score=6.14 TRINITY_DN12123_c0_g1_i3:615-917(-)
MCIRDSPKTPPILYRCSSKQNIIAMKDNHESLSEYIPPSTDSSREVSLNLANEDSHSNGWERVLGLENVAENDIEQHKRKRKKTEGNENALELEAAYFLF